MKNQEVNKKLLVKAYKSNEKEIESNYVEYHVDEDSILNKAIRDYLLENDSFLEMIINNKENSREYIKELMKREFIAIVEKYIRFIEKEEVNNNDNKGSKSILAARNLQFFAE